MGARLTTKVAQLSIVAGIQQETASDVALVERSARIPYGFGKGNLYVLVEVTGDAAGKDQLCRELIETLAEEYFRVPGGITNSLRQAIRAANRRLYERNLESLPLWRRVGGASCAVLRRNDLYMGLAGRALIYVVQKERLRIFPPPSSPRSMAFAENEQPTLPSLGVEEHLGAVGLFHSHIEPADMILLASSTLPQVAGAQEVIKAAQGGVREVVRALPALATHADLSALVIETQTQEAEEGVAEEPLLDKGRSIASGLKTGRVRRKRARRTETTGKGIRSRFRGLAAGFAALILGFFGRLARGVGTFFSWLVSSGVLGTLGRQVKAVITGAVRGLGTLGRRMLPEPQAAPQPMEVVHTRRGRAVSAPRRKGLLPLVGVFTIITLVALIAAGIAISHRSRVARLSQLLDEAQAETELARSSSGPADMREHLEKAQQLVAQALDIGPTDSRAVALQEDVSTALDEINQVVRLQFSAHLPFAGPEHHPRHLVLHGNDVYVLDEGAQELYGYFIDEQDAFREPAGGAVLLSQEDRPGGASIEELNDLVWMESGDGRETSNLILLINSSSLLQLDALRGFTPLAVADSELWSATPIMGSYFGYLYALDSEQDRIFKYAPTVNGYDASPSDYFRAGTSVDLSNAVDMAIDGYIYVLLADGSILKFLGGQQQAFSLTGLGDRELQEPTAIFTSPQTEYIYVADGGDQRVVQLDKEGSFVRQFRPARENAEAFQDLQDVYLNEARGELLALTSDALSLALIPEAPQAEE